MLVSSEFSRLNDASHGSMAPAFCEEDIEGERIFSLSQSMSISSVSGTVESSLKRFD
jgi:hypothetical protein